MKKLLIPLSFCLFAISSISAQEKGGFENKKPLHGKHQAIAEKLNLTAQQQQQMKTIQQDFKTKAKALKSNDNITLGNFKKKMQELKEQRKAQVSAILTDDQKAKMKAGRENKMKQNATAHFERLKTELQLTEDQQVSLKKKQTEVQQQMKAIHQNEALTKEQKKEQILALNKERKDYLKSVLNAEQVQKLEAMKPARK
jgi:hypothetical protein